MAAAVTLPLKATAALQRYMCRVCVFLYLLTRYMRPEGPWQRLAAALADSSAFLNPFRDQILSPTTMGHTGAALSPPPHHPPNEGEDIK